jgi:hypothetical protein
MSSHSVIVQSEAEVWLRTARACHGEKYLTLSRLHTHTVSGNSFEDDENRRQIGEDSAASFAVLSFVAR